MDVDLTDADLGRTDLTDTILLRADFIDSDLADSDLTDSDLWRADLTDANLSKATLVGANLERATLTHADLGGSTLYGAHLYDARFWDVAINDRTTFGDRCYYELAADPLSPTPTEDDDLKPQPTDTDSNWFVRKLTTFRTGGARLRAHWSLSEDDRKDTAEQLDKAISVYRTRQQLYRENSLPDRIPTPYVREKHCRRKKAFVTRRWLDWPKRSLKRWVMLYGESPHRVVASSIVLIVLFAGVYHALGGVHLGDGPVEAFVENLYFSTITFSTLGYADINPATTTTQLLASAQSLIGGVMIALLVAVLGRRVMR